MTRQRVLLDACSNAKSNQILNLKHPMIHDNMHYDVPLYNLGRGGAVFPLGAFWTVPPIVLSVAPPGYDDLKLNFNFIYKTLPKAQRIRELSSAYQSNFLRPYYEFLHKSC